MDFLNWYLKLLSKSDLINLRRIINDKIYDKSSHSERVKSMYNDLSHSHIRGKLLSPVKPSIGDIKIYHKYLSQITPLKKVLILGSTPELRDLVSKLGIKNYIVADFSFSMIEKSLKFCKKVNFENEIWIKSNWLELPFTHNFFDVIVGDLVHSQIPISKQKVFLKKINLLLQPGGYFISRIHSANKKFFAVHSENIIENILKNISVDTERQLSFTLVVSHLRDCLRNDKTKMTNPQDILNALYKYKAKDEKERKVLEEAVKLVAKRAEENIGYVSQTEDEFMSCYLEHFLYKEKESAKDYDDAQYFPVFCFKKSD